MRVRKSLMIVMLVAIMLVPATIVIAESQSNAPAQGVEIMAVCHVDGLDNFSPVTIADPALDSHLAHGDAQPGDAVPGMLGYIFDETCTPVEDLNRDCTRSEVRICRQAFMTCKNHICVDPADY